MTRDQLIDLTANLPTFIKSIFSTNENAVLDQPPTVYQPISTPLPTLFPEENLDDWAEIPSTSENWIILPSASDEKLKVSLKREREETTDFDIDWPENPAPLPDFGSFRRNQEKVDHEIYNGYYSDINERNDVVSVKSSNDNDDDDNDEEIDDGGIQLWAGEHFMPSDPMGWLRTSREEDEIDRFVTKIEWLGEKIFVDIELHLINGEVVKEMAYGKNRKKTERKVAEAMIKTIAQRRKYKLPIF